MKTNGTSQSGPGVTCASDNDTLVATNDHWGEAIEHLRSLDAEIAPVANRHERVIALIHACISIGLDHGSLIAAALAELGFNSRHVWLLLDKMTGPVPERHHWCLVEDGRYRSHPLK